MKSNYILHDKIYQRRRESGYPGWADEVTLQTNLNSIEQAFANKYAPTGGRVLELGCGAGDITLWQATQGFESYGVDISPTAIGWAKEKAREGGLNVDFRVGSVLDLAAYADCEFDAVIDGYCLHCIIAEDRSAFLQNAFRVLKPGGVFHVRTMCGDVASSHLKLSPQFLETFDFASRCTLTKEGMPTRYIGLPNDILREVRSAGFDVLDDHVQPSAGELNHMDMLFAWAVRTPPTAD